MSAVLPRELKEVNPYGIAGGDLRGVPEWEQCKDLWKGAVNRRPQLRIIWTLVMDKVVNIAISLYRRIPFLILFSAFLYVAGHRFSANYWRAIGLPLMTVDQTVNDSISNGFFGLSLWLTSSLKVANPIQAVLLLSCGCVAVYQIGDLFVTGLGDYKRDLAKPWVKPLAPAWLLAVDKWARRSTLEFITVSIPQILAVILLSGFMLAVFGPLAGVEKMGKEYGDEQLVELRRSLSDLREGRVLVPAVTFRRASLDRIEIGVPINCGPDQCAIMSESGPLAVPKDRVLDQYVQAPFLAGKCYFAQM